MTGQTEQTTSPSRTERSVLTKYYVVLLAALVVVSSIALALPPPTGHRAVLVEIFETGTEYGVAVRADYTSTDPLRVTGASLEGPTGMLESDGMIWDDDVPDPEVGFDFVDIGGAKEVGLTFGFVPDCDQGADYESLVVTVRSEQGEREVRLNAEGLDQAVNAWCTEIRRTYLSAREVTEDAGLVTAEWLVTVPHDRGATLTVSSPGWSGEPLDVSADEQQAMISAQSQAPCRLDYNPIRFDVEYSDGSTGVARGRLDLADIC